MNDVSEMQREQIIGEFERLLKAELDRRKIPYAGVELRDIGVNLDVYIHYPDNDAGHYQFRYLGWEWIVYRVIDDLGLADYVKQYAKSYCKEIGDYYQERLSEARRMLLRKDMWPHDRVEYKESARVAGKILRQLSRVKE